MIASGGKSRRSRGCDLLGGILEKPGQYVHRRVDLLPRKEEGRKEADHISLHDIQHQPLCEGGLHDWTTWNREFNSLNQATSARFDDDFGVVRNLDQLLAKIGSGIRHLGEQTIVFHHGEILKAETTGHGTST